jgi:hypothetical protein
MSNVVRGAPPKVAPQVYDAIRALLRAGKNDDAIVQLQPGVSIPFAINYGGEMGLVQFLWCRELS